MSDSQAELRRALRSAYEFGDDYPHPGLLARISAEINAGQQRQGTGWPFAGAVAAALAILIVTVFVLIPRQGAQTQGPLLPTSASITGLVSYQFASASVGWVHLEPGNGLDVIANTSDGGRTWHRQLTLTTMTPASTMQWVDDRNGFLFGQSDAASVIWRTNDGGAHWHFNVVSVSPAGPPAPWVLLTGYFLNPTEGWLLFGPNYDNCVGCLGRWDGALYASTDGGNQWHEVGNVPANLNGYWPRMQFFSSAVGTVGNGFGPSLVSRYLTRDGGRTWTMPDVMRGVFCPGLPKCPAHLVEAPIFFSANEGVSVVTLATPTDRACPAASPGSSPSGGCRITIYPPAERLLYATTDAGLTWTLTRHLPAAEGQLIVFDANRWIDVEPNGVESTIDGGGTWSKSRPIPLPAGWSVSQAEFFTATTGVVTISNSPNAATMASAGSFHIQGSDLEFAMLTTSDGGATWQRIALPSS